MTLTVAPPTAPPLHVYGDVQQNAVDQMLACIQYGNVVGAVLTADHHLGYSHPVGGVIAYDGQVSVSGVGFDIGCGNKAVKLDCTVEGIDTAQLADEIFKHIEFGVGRTNNERVEHELFDSPAWDVLEEVAGKHQRDRLHSLARKQLGTVGSGNHYVDVFTEEDHLKHADGEEPVWIGNHFGSRGLGHNIASGFLRLAAGKSFDYRPAKGERIEKEEPTLLDLDTDLGATYMALMELAGDYAYAGRDYVCQRVADIIGANIVHEVHNHHNYAWSERDTIVVRKGATPLNPGQQSFIGGSMCDLSVIVEGADSDQSDYEAALYSTVHGAGRVMGRMAAKGKRDKQTGEWKREPGVTEEAFRQSVADYGIELRGAGVDESMFVYRRLPDVLDAHASTTKVIHRLRPIVVCMAGADVRDPYKD